MPLDVFDKKHRLNCIIYFFTFLYTELKKFPEDSDDERGFQRCLEHLYRLRAVSFACYDKFDDSASTTEVFWAGRAQAASSTQRISLDRGGFTIN
jgi:hypothetical protein